MPYQSLRGHPLSKSTVEADPRCHPLKYKLTLLILWSFIEISLLSADKKITQRG